MKAQAQSLAETATTETPEFHADRRVMLRFKEPKEYARRRAQREFARLSARERFLLTYFFLIASLLAIPILAFIPNVPARFSWPWILLEGLLGSGFVQLFYIRLPLWYPDSRVSFSHRGVSRSGSSGKAGYLYGRFSGYYFTQRDGFELVCLRFAHPRESKETVLGIDLKMRKEVEFALPDPRWREPVRQALNHAGMSEVRESVGRVDQIHE